MECPILDDNPGWSPQSRLDPGLVCLTPLGCLPLCLSRVARSARVHNGVPSVAPSGRLIRVVEFSASGFFGGGVFGG